jgi:hypothetical protein
MVSSFRPAQPYSFRHSPEGVSGNHGLMPGVFQFYGKNEYLASTRVRLTGRTVRFFALVLIVNNNSCNKISKKAGTTIRTSSYFVLIFHILGHPARISSRCSPPS